MSDDSDRSLIYRQTAKKSNRLISYIHKHKEERKLGFRPLLQMPRSSIKEVSPLAASLLIRFQRIFPFRNLVIYLYTFHLQIQLQVTAWNGT